MTPLLFNWRCVFGEVALFSGQQKLLMPGIVLSARYAKDEEGRMSTFD